jgi:hypothetical protein
VRSQTDLPLAIKPANGSSPTHEDGDVTACIRYSLGVPDAWQSSIAYGQLVLTIRFDDLRGNRERQR